MTQIDFGAWESPKKLWENHFPSMNFSFPLLLSRFPLMEIKFPLFQTHFPATKNKIASFRARNDVKENENSTSKNQ